MQHQDSDQHDSTFSLPVTVATPPPGPTFEFYAVAEIVTRNKGRKTDVRARVTVYQDSSLIDGADAVVSGANVSVDFGPDGSTPTTYSGLSDANGEFESPWQSAGNSSFTATIDNSEDQWSESLSSLQATWSR